MFGRLEFPRDLENDATHSRHCAIVGFVRPSSSAHNSHFYGHPWPPLRGHIAPVEERECEEATLEGGRHMRSV
ncbi:hypothetical protein DMENIID0001_140700 [Sergentomyia squamirostris]